MQFAGIAYIFAILSPAFIAIILVTSSISVLLSFKTQKLDFKCKTALAETARELDYLSKTMSDYKNAKEIRVNRAEDFLCGKYSKILNDQNTMQQRFVKQNIRIELLSVIITVLQSASMYLFFSYQVFTSAIKIADYTVLLGATTLLTSLLFGFFSTIARINNILNYTQLFKEYRSIVDKNSSISASLALPKIDFNTDQLTIAFENVSFTYPGSTRPILKNINITLRKGEKVGLVGLNGSGKTTLVKLLCRLYDPTEGRITLNGIDIKAIPYDQYSKLIGIVLQDYCLFAYPIRENIIFDAIENKEKLMHSIEKSGLQSKINSLPRGLDTSVYKILDDNGVELSGGEGQKLALARAIYKDASILILDEPTSALDPLAEYELFLKLSELSQGKTTLFISHRLSSTRFCDRIFVLFNSTITETGSHEELIQKNGIYADLFRSQLKYYENGGTV